MNTLNLIFSAVSILSASPLSVLKANDTSSTFSIETSTVQQDLYCFYKDRYPTNTLSYLVPHKENGDEYNDFKLLTMYAYKGDLYLYFYSELPYEFTSVNFTYSTSTLLNEDMTSVVEDYKTSSTRIHDVNGTNKRFYKVVCDDFYTYEEGSKHRVKASKITGIYNTYTIFSRYCSNNEYSWEDPKDGVDQVYTYYHNNYVIINESTAILNLINTKYDALARTDASEAKEINWLFFNYDYTSLGSSYSLGNLVEASVSYEYLTYDVTYRVNGTPYENVYAGLYEDSDDFFLTYGHSARESEFYNLDSKREEVKVKPSSKRLKTDTVSTTLFFVWNITKSIDYSYNTIQALDDTSVSNISDKDFKEFIEKNKENYKYAIDFKESYRNRLKTEQSYYNPLDFFTDTRKVYSRCHEARDITLVKLAFENQDGIAELNALMNATDEELSLFTSPTTYTSMTLFGVDVDEISKNLWIISGVALSVGLLALILYFYLKYRSTHPKIKRAYEGAKMSYDYKNKSYKSKAFRHNKKPFKKKRG